MLLPFSRESFTACITQATFKSEVIVKNKKLKEPKFKPQSFVKTVLKFLNQREMFLNMSVTAVVNTYKSFKGANWRVYLLPLLLVIKKCV